MSGILDKIGKQQSANEYNRTAIQARRMRVAEGAGQCNYHTTHNLRLLESMDSQVKDLSYVNKLSYRNREHLKKVKNNHAADLGHGSCLNNNLIHL